MHGEHTFLIPAYGRSPWLPQCIESLLGQTVPSGIRICTSTPDPYLEEIAARYGLPLDIAPSHTSIAEDWNFALSRCETRWCTLAHQDDLYYPTYTERLLPRMGNALIGFTDYEEIANGTTRPATAMMRIKRILLSRARRLRELPTRSGKRSVLRFGSAICCPSVLYDLERLCGFSFSGEYHVNLDWDAWLRMSDMDGSFVFEDGILVGHRIHEDSETTRQIANSGRKEEDRRMMRRLWPAPVAGALSLLYAHSTDFNRIGATK